MPIQLTQWSQSEPNGHQLKVVCPVCRHKGTFDRLPVNDVSGPLWPDNVASAVLGQRICPDLQCRAHVFFMYRSDTKEYSVFPAALMDFDPTGIPSMVSDAVDEAIRCIGAGCNKAAAMMTRKALEALCEAQGAKGANLKERVASLGNAIVIPRALIEGLDSLRVLGNDAAHIDARDYDVIDRPQVETALEFTKEVLKAAYQYGALLERLKPSRSAAGVTVP